jgi:putative transposase
MKYSVSQFMGYLKGKSSLMIFDKHANLKYKFGNRHYIAMDKLSTKEYEDPFDGWL